MSITIIIPTTVPNKNGMIFLFAISNTVCPRLNFSSSDTHSSSILLASFTISHSHISESALSRTTKYASENTSLPVLLRYTILF